MKKIHVSQGHLDFIELHSHVHGKEGSQIITPKHGKYDFNPFMVECKMLCVLSIHLALMDIFFLLSLSGLDEELNPKWYKEH